MPLIGLISDTHGLMRLEAIEALAGCERILHAGDVGDVQVLDRLARIAPLIAVRGNNDIGAWADALPGSVSLEIGGCAVHMVHDLAGLAIEPASAHVVVSGHSHRPAIVERNGVLHVNPGSAGPRRFRLPVTVALLEIASGKAAARVVELAVAPPAAVARRRARTGTAWPP